MVTLTTDDVWPRDEENRFRLYTRNGDVSAVVASGPTLEHIGRAFGELLAEGEIDASARVGVMDTHGDQPPPRRPGTWIVNPHA